MATYEERKEKVRQLIRDEDANLSLRESMSFAWHWFMFEWYLRRRRRINAKCHEHAMILNHDLNVYELRKEMKEI